jgi:hypothetical protein
MPHQPLNEMPAGNLNLWCICFLNTNAKLQTLDMSACGEIQHI